MLSNLILCSAPFKLYSVGNPQIEVVCHSSVKKGQGFFYPVNVLLCIYGSIFRMYTCQDTNISRHLPIFLKHSCFLMILLQALHLFLGVAEQLVLGAPSHRPEMSSSSWSQDSVLQDLLYFSSYQQTLRKLIYMQCVL